MRMRCIYVYVCEHFHTCYIFVRFFIGFVQNYVITYLPVAYLCEFGTNRSEGFPLTCYFIPVRDGAGVWTFGNLRLPPFKQEKDSGIIGLVRPAGGTQNIFKTN